MGNKRVKKPKRIMSLVLVFIMLMSYFGGLSFDFKSEYALAMEYCTAETTGEVCTDACCTSVVETVRTLADTTTSSNDIALLAYNDTTCTVCNGTGTGTSKCTTCGGNGWWIRTDTFSFSTGTVYVYVLFGCADCGGSGNHESYNDKSALDYSKITYGSGLGACATCEGDGKVSSPDIYITATSGSGQTILQGDNSIVSVTAEVRYSTTTAYMSYQWYISTDSTFTPSTATLIDGATSSAYNLCNLSVGTHYLKAVVSSAGLSDVTSSALTVTVEAAPLNLGITEDLQNVSIVEGTNTIFSVMAEAIYSDGSTSTSELNYQWYQNGSVLSGETGSTLTIGANEEVGVTLIYVIISADGFDEIKSSNVILTVTPAVTNFYITKDISSTAITEGETTIFTVSAQKEYSDGAVSTSGMSYQWYKDNVQISGATSNTLTVGSDLSSGTYNYYVKISTDGFSDINSSTAALTVNAAATSIQITKDITSQSILEGENASFSVSAEVGYSNGTTSSSGISYQWYRNGTAISGATESTLTIGKDLASGEYLIYVKATYGNFTTTSSTVNLSIAAKTFIDVTYAFSDSSITEYSSKTLQVIAVGIDSDGNAYGEPITYQWFIDGEEIEGATDSTYSFKGDLKTMLNADGLEEKVSPSEYFVQVKLTCYDCADVYVSGTISVNESEAMLIVCNTCLGAGEIPCQNDCGDSHGVACVYCDGTGFDDSVYYHAYCTLCESDGFVECYMCEGDGMMDCPDCGPEAPAVNNNVKDEDPDAWYVEAIKEMVLSVTIYTAGLIDLLITLFKKLVGLENVTIGGTSANLLMYFLDDTATRAVLIGTMAIGFVLLFVFTIIGFVRSMQTTDEKVNAGSVFEKFIMSALNIILVPTLLVLLIFCTNVVMGQINQSLEDGVIYSTEDVNDNMEISYGGQMLMLLADNEYDKAKIFDITVNNVRWSDVSELLYYKDVATLDIFFPDGQISENVVFGTDSILYSQGQTFPNYAYMDITNWTDAKNGIYYIPTSRLNVFVAFAGCIAMLVALILCSFTFVKRIFDVMLLYIVSPIMISTTPVDDGTRFKQWRDLMISKVISAYAIVLTVNLYFMIVPKIIINPGVIFDLNNSVANGIIQLLFVIGGAFALNGANLVFSQLLGTGNMEHQQNVGTQMALVNMARVGAGVAKGVGIYAVGTALTTAKHGTGITIGGISSAVKGGNGGFTGIVSNFGKGAGGYVASSVGGSRFGTTMKNWISNTQGGSGSANS